MEATALFDFDAVQVDELSFKKGEQICILNVVGDEGWVSGVKGLTKGYLPEAYIKREPHPWLTKCDTREQAHDLLLYRNAFGHFVHPDGVFLIRASTKDKGSFSLSVKHNGTVIHYKIMKDDHDNKFYIWGNAKFVSINDLVRNYHDKTVSPDPGKQVFLMDPQPVYEALYDFRATGSEELGLTKGDIIHFVQIESEDGWADGEVNGRRGLFPVNYVREIRPGGVWWEF